MMLFLLREVAKYLLFISTEQNIIYYRNGELIYEYNVDHPEPISINDLFRKELRPTMGGDPVPKEYNMPAGVFKIPPRYFVEKEKKEIPLIEAARIGDLETIDALINKWDINASYRSGETALIAAIKYKHSQASLALIQKGANLEASDWYGTALLWAIAMDDTDVIKQLCQSGAGVNKSNYSNGFSALMIASARGNITAVEELIATGADVNARTKMSKMTALHCALGPTLCDRAGSIETMKEIVKILIKHKADVNVQSYDGLTPWLRAVEMMNNNEIALILENAGAKKTIRKQKGFLME